MKGHEVMNHILRDEMPDIEKVRNNCHKQAVAYASKNTSRFKRFVPVAAVLVMFFAVSTTVFAAVGGFDWFVQRFNPRFADVVEPVMIYSESEGIRITVLSAQSFENMAVIYLSVTEQTEANRLTEDMDWWPGLQLHIRGMGGGSSQNLLYFDAVNSTAYLEIRFATSEEIPYPMPLVVESLNLYPAEPVAGNWELAIYTGDAADWPVAVVAHEFMLCDVILINRMVLTPLGLVMEGIYAIPSDDAYFAPLRANFQRDVYAETADGLVFLVASSGSMNSGPLIRDGEYVPTEPLIHPGSTNIRDGVMTRTPLDAIATTVAEFMERTGDINVTINWKTQAPLDVSAVTAIIINGQRIPIP
jgi:hypothetical protein